jgi:predicted RNase H-like HicB family nuclease
MTHVDELDRQVARPWTRELAQDGDVVAARVVELDGCFSEGTTMAEALANLDDALEIWLSAAIESGVPIPTPRGETDVVEYSGRFTVRLPKSWHRKLAEAAAQEGVSLNQHVSTLLVAAGAGVQDRRDDSDEVASLDTREDITADAVVHTSESIGALKRIAAHLQNRRNTNLACLIYAFAAERVARDAGAQEAARELGTAAALAHRSGSNALAEALWRESTRLDVTNVRSASRLGQLLHHQGRYAEAADLLELAAADDNYAANFLGWSRIQLGLQEHDPDLLDTGLEDVAGALRRWAYQASQSQRSGWVRQVRRLARLGRRSARVIEQLVSYANANSNWGRIDVSDVLSRSDEDDSDIDRGSSHSGEIAI